MVLSKINSEVSYTELKSVDPSDLQKEANLFQINVDNVDIIIAVGNANKTFENRNIIYFPIYLVKNNNKVTQIGVYEILNTDLNGSIDEYNNLDLERTNLDPLIYQFVNKDMLERLRKIPEESETEAERENNDNSEKDKNNRLKKGTTTSEQLEEPQEIVYIPENRADIFTLTTGATIPHFLKEETKKHAKDWREKYHEDASDTWVQKFMKNKNYYIVDNEGGGDCLFATVRDAFSQIAQQTSVQKLRNKLSTEATEEIFLNYREQYNMYHDALVKDTNEIKELEKEYANIRAKFRDVLDRNEQKQLADLGKKVKEKHDIIVKEKKVTADILKEYKFMKNVDTLEKFKKLIRSCEFWGETWTISTLERILNIKFIILSHEAYSAKPPDLDNVLQCGQLNDIILQNKGVFNPEYYIIVDYNGSHYKLVGYKKKLILKYKEIPYDLKHMIVDKCMEKNAGVFSLINDFKRFKQENYKETTQKLHEIHYEDLTEAKIKGVYDDNVVLSFYSKSASKPLPGKGSGEKIPDNMLKDFSALATIPDWRKKLTNSWVKEFTLDNHKWASVEHYYQASKFKKNNQPFYLSFTLDSGTELSKSPELAKAAGSKSGKLKTELLRPVEVEIDPDFYNGRNDKEMYEAQYAKFTQNDELKKLLLNTNNAKLVHHVRASEPEVFENLMLIRDKIRKG